MSDSIYRVKTSGVYSQEQKPGLQKSYLKGPNPTHTVNYYCWIQKKPKQIIFMEKEEQIFSQMLFWNSGRHPEKGSHLLEQPSGKMTT